MAKAAEDPEMFRVWADAWVKQAGVNLLMPEVVLGEESKVIERLIVKQTGPLRPHRLSALLLDAAGAVIAQEVVQIQPKIETELQVFSGKPAPALVILNADDTSFCRTGFDQNSLLFLREKYLGIEGELSSLQRAVVWRSLMDMVKTCHLSSLVYLEMVASCIGVENNPAVLQLLVRDAKQAMTTLCPTGPHLDELMQRTFTALVKKL
jgi:aminopeptidase N